MTIDRQTAELLAQINNAAAASGAETASATDDDIAAAREGADALFIGLAGEAMTDCIVRDLEMPGPGGAVPVRAYRPLGGASAPSLQKESLKKGAPAVVFFHGGGWSLGNVAAYDGLVRALCCLSGVTFFSVDYRLAPEHPHPAPLEDCLAVTRWLLEHGAELDCDVQRLAVMGDSCGGNLAAAVAQRLWSEQAAPSFPRLKAQFLLYPVMDISRTHEDYPSRMAWGDGEYLLARAGIDQAADWYAPDRTCRAHPDISPLRQSSAALAGLPPGLLLVGDHDPLLDETTAYARALAAAGVPCEVKIFEGAIHAFLSFGVLDQAWEGRRYLAGRVRDLLDLA